MSKQKEKNVETLRQSDNERKMRGKFSQKVEEVVSNSDRYSTELGGLLGTVGIENEYGLVYANNLEPVSDEDKMNLMEALNSVAEEDFVDTEVGASMIEIQTEPIHLDSLDDLYEEVKAKEEKLESEAERRGIELIRSGTNPLQELDSIGRTDEEKYRRVPNAHEEYRSNAVIDRFGIKETLDPRNSDIPGIICATQQNICAGDFDEAIRKSNLLYQNQSYLSALIGNSRMVGMRDTGIAETRPQMWTISHDLRTEEQIKNGKMPRAGKIDSFWEDMRDYLTGIPENQPFILYGDESPEAALDIANGMYWKHVRAKPERTEDGDYQALVEGRISSMQPTLEEDVAVHGFLFGKLCYDLTEDTDLLDIGKVNRNISAGLHNGLETFHGGMNKLYDPEGELREAQQVLEEEIEKAEEGLRRAGIGAGDYLDILRGRVEEGRVPSDIAAEKFESALSEGRGRRDAVYEALESKEQYSWR